MAIELANVRASGEPLRQYNHDLVIPNVPNGGDGEAFRLRLLNTVLPGFQSEVFESNHFGFVTKHAGRGLFPRVLTAEYEESADMIVYRTLSAWYQLQWDINTGVQVSSDLYKTDGFLQVLDGEKNVVGTVNLFNMFIEDVADAPLDGAVSEGVRVPVSFSYDEIEYEF